MKISAGVCHVKGRLIASKYFQSQPGLYTSVRVIPKYIWIHLIRS